MKDKSAIIPYRYTKGKLQVLIVKNSDNTKWVIPKGTVEMPLKPVVSATKEAYEEAGVLGIPHPILVGTYRKNNQDVPTYLLEVIVELKHYEEDSKRSRKWQSISELNESIVDDDLLKLIKLGGKIVKKNGYYFKYAIQTFCDIHNINIEKISKKKALVTYSHSKNTDFNIEISRSGTFLDFTLKSKTSFKILDQIPQELMADLLLKNNTDLIGYWSLSQIEKGYVFSRRYNEELHLLNCQLFMTILQKLVESCISFEALLKTEKK